MITSALKALDLLRKPGAFLYENKSQSSNEFYLHPFGKVRPDIAAKIIDHPQVRASEDGMWPGMSQTWKMPESAR